jgi:hypothetical protein
LCLLLVDDVGMLPGASLLDDQGAEEWVPRKERQEENQMSISNRHDVRLDEKGTGFGAVGVA